MTVEESEILIIYTKNVNILHSDKQKLAFKTDSDKKISMFE